MKFQRKTYESLVEKILFLCAITSIVAVFTITFFIFYMGLPLIFRTGLNDFLLNTQWAPLRSIFGILPMIMGSVMVTLGALVIAVPLGLGGAIFLAEFAPKYITRILRPAIQLLAGIPSVVYGFWGLIILVPILRSYLGGSGFSALAGSIILAIMILPTIVNISEDSLLSVPGAYKEGSLALGATSWQTIKHVILPCARPGIITAIVLGMGRAIGETMAIIMVTGNVASMPQSFLDPVRTLTGNIVIEIGYAHGEHQEALFATGVVLFVFIMVLNILVNLRLKKEER
ncbi:MAG: phosphate ABC transporter permease subunit PstC [Candidatus Syntrophonatronum acetioxidans]|uniref:Phosphate ABC transporter permease subunit PstC n=1 Tax=Candidatus Syntrophonatronum acetioxidans TaxID=1795816 RepID=A0A424YG58_9FIRM|nr:MAG: phosphate ABC transporter permease subunit PstC [Candidatus Syntrophonatronum acetioxidans]